MKSLKLAVLAACGVLLAVGSARAADWELWPDKTQMPPGELLEGLPITPTGENLATIWIDLGDQTLEKDGVKYKALQMFRDQKFTATVPVGRYLIGLLGNALPAGTVDLMAMTAAMNLVSVEVDGTVIPIDSSYLLFAKDLVAPGHDVGLYNVFPRFNTPGTHTYVERFKLVDPFFWVEPYAQEAACGTDCGYIQDPWPEFAGHYVWVPEQVGDPVDGVIVYEYTLTVVEEPTAVAPSTWGQVKDAQK